MAEPHQFSEAPEVLSALDRAILMLLDRLAKFVPVFFPGIYLVWVASLSSDPEHLETLRAWLLERIDFIRFFFFWPGQGENYDHTAIAYVLFQGFIIVLLTSMAIRWLLLSATGARVMGLYRVLDIGGQKGPFSEPARFTASVVWLTAVTLFSLSLLLSVPMPSAPVLKMLALAGPMTRIAELPDTSTPETNGEEPVENVQIDPRAKKEAPQDGPSIKPDEPPDDATTFGDYSDMTPFGSCPDYYIDPSITNASAAISPFSDGDFDLDALRDLVVLSPLNQQLRLAFEVGFGFPDAKAKFRVPVLSEVSESDIGSLAAWLSSQRKFLSQSAQGTLQLVVIGSADKTGGARTNCAVSWMRAHYAARTFKQALERISWSVPIALYGAGTWLSCSAQNKNIRTDLTAWCDKLFVGKTEAEILKFDRSAIAIFTVPPETSTAVGGPEEEK